MLQTYLTENEFNMNRRSYQKAKIDSRYQCNLKDVPLEKKYDLVTGHWVLGYLTDEDLFVFLQRLRTKLIHGRPKDKPGIVIVKEDITEYGEENYLDEK